MNRALTLLTLTTACLAAARASADKSLEGIACRSVHLAYPAPAGEAFVNSVRVEASAPGTYFCVCGFSKGYYGIQQLGDGKRLLIFSVWDPGKQNDPDSVESDRRVKLLYKDPEVRVGRFGNEGTGGQSFLDFPWKDGQTYHFAVSARVDGPRTEYTSWFVMPDSGKWRKLVTFSTLAGGRELNGYYAFVEDFKRDRVSATIPRRATFGPAWVLNDDGWLPVTEARFTADSNPAMTIDAGPKEAGFFLATGGKTTNRTTKLRERMQRPGEPPEPPALLAAFKEALGE